MRPFSSWAHNLQWPSRHLESFVDLGCGIHPGLRQGKGQSRENQHLSSHYQVQGKYHIYLHVLRSLYIHDTPC